MSSRPFKLYCKTYSLRDPNDNKIFIILHASKPLCYNHVNPIFSKLNIWRMYEIEVIFED